ncbi:MAG: solute carrier family 25 iron transporter 28/37 [Bacillariaceae sp.]|jgi:solute carrier family 25 iron transporter 28/37
MGSTDNQEQQPQSSVQQQQQPAEFDDEWEEWDGISPFWVHCVAGSFAGVAEHVLVYPLDTVRTHIQVCAACHFNPATHNPSTQGVSHAAAQAQANSHIPGSILQKAAMSATNMTTTTAATNTIQKSTASAMHNPSMLQAIRQLISQPLALETSASVTTTGNAGTGTVASSSSSSASSSSSSSSSSLKNVSSSMVTKTAEGTGGGATAKTAMEGVISMTRLWRGVQTILIGCIPAHALYFSTYEIVKSSTLDAKGNVTGYGSALAGGAAVIAHDIVLGPLDTVKQRLQLGHYRSFSHALTTMIKNEGPISLVRSFPITLATNIPYGMIMVGTNEFLKKQWTSNADSNGSNNELTLGVTLGASSFAGLVAAATTTPLDRIKTYLQTQQLTPSCLLSQQGINTSPDICPLQQQANAAGNAAAGNSNNKPLVANWKQAAIRIYRTEGYTGFFRGVTPRILSHTPAVAISWTTYETLKKLFTEHCA